MTREGTGVPARLRCEYCTNPLGVDQPDPRLSWEMEGTEDGYVQSAYRILVTLGPDTVWDSGKVASSRQNAVPYSGAKLQSKSRYVWKVKTWDRHDGESPWSEGAFFETGLFRAEDWGCRWFNCEYPNSPTAVYYERREFFVRGDVPLAAARVYIGATGSKSNAYVLRVNGAQAGDDRISPGQTHFKRGLYRTYDVTGSLRPGSNAVGILHTRKVIFRLELRYEDGSTDAIVSDASWKRLKKGPYLALRYPGGSISEGKGETYDARLEPEGWDLSGYDDSSWGRPITDQGPLMLTGQLQPIRCIEGRSPVSITRPLPNTYVVDFGQNLFGAVRLTVTGQAGTRITLRYAEILGPEGRIDPGTTEAGWLAEPQPQYDEYILRGREEEVYEPRFSFHGFRYAEVTGYPGELDAGRITAQVIHNDILNGSAFACSHALLNRLQHAAVWSFRTNLVSVPMDCPSRERQGWLGDAHCHSEADLLNFDMGAFYDKWFDDISDSQLENGMVPLICPSEGHEYSLDMPWAAAVVLIPWDYYMAYGDKAFLRKHYPLMKRCLGSFEPHLDRNDLLQNSLLFGDWFGSAKDISPVFLATAYYYRCLVLMGRMGEVLGYPDDTALYSRLAFKVQAGINAAYLKEGQYYDTNSQTANALALYLGFVPEGCIPAVLNSLVEDILARETLTVGCLGAEAILAALAENGRNDIAYYLAANTNPGCWGYWIREYGATTALESFHDNRSSNNHAFLIGGLSAWFYKHLAGISPLSPGYERIRIRPYIPEDMNSAYARIHTVRGTVQSSWHRIGSKLVLQVTIPPNAAAEVHLPSGGKERQPVLYTVGSGQHEFAVEVTP